MSFFDFGERGKLGFFLLYKDLDLKINALLNNFEIEISKNEKSASFYVIGCYFGGLYLLEKETLKYNMYSEFEGSDMWD